MSMLARRVLPDGAWESIVLPHMALVSEDSHNVILLSVSPEDDVLHVAMDCHSTPLYYPASSAGLASGSGSWAASSFAIITNTLRTLSNGSTITYPQFVISPGDGFQFVYCTGVSGDGAAQLAEYSDGVWSSIGSWTSASSTYTADNSATSSARNLYIDGFTYHDNRTYVTGTWRENNDSVSCSSGEPPTTTLFTFILTTWVPIYSSIQVHYKAFNTEDIYVGSINNVVRGAGLNLGSIGADKAFGEIMDNLKKRLTAVIVDSCGKELDRAESSTRQVATHETLDAKLMVSQFCVFLAPEPGSEPEPDLGSGSVRFSPGFGALPEPNLRSGSRF
ncbi:hypothetical protein FISHEDRAFT_68819 [Fistulina hepatica ATCC 64428]|uniref:Fucose-specific lectin n=1 Tax=Fistulina hepatica ATCC 64428 TaxID=1128425 RepID=A0A0D7APL4_9AGAR|nr:hypothetical protein FISHEDRAFT_68819 [Fistulina hepatica ATCC 64428]